MTLATKRSRKQIEQHIERCAEAIQKNRLEIGLDLTEIRDNELWDDEFSSWEDYHKTRVPELFRKSFSRTVDLIIKTATEIAKESAPQNDKPVTPSVRDIRKAVDQELGIDRKAEAAKAKS